MENIKRLKTAVVQNVRKGIIGKDSVIELLLIAFLAEGHILLEDLPGMGKTMLVRSFSKTLDLPFKRIQFTPDLLPGDITGVSYYNQKEREFEFRPGPLFSNVILADEINRATPRTQSALLEAMEERQITVDGDTRTLERPFMVMATQNPIESYGTFPLPEAQMDRFLMRISMGYPKKEEERRILLSALEDVFETIHSVYDRNELLNSIEEIKKVKAKKEVMDYLLDLVEKTRNHNEISVGVSPRGSIALFRASQAKAAMEGRGYMLPEDIQYMAPFILNHRISSGMGQSLNETVEIIEDIVRETKVPLEDLEAL